MQREQEKKFFDETFRKAGSEPDIDAAISMIGSAIKVYSNSPSVKMAREYLQKLCVDKDKAEKAPREKKRKRDAIASKGQIPKVIDGFLDAQRWGKIGTEYWEDPGLARKLPGVIDWRIIDQRVFGTVALVRVDIDSKLV